jgi:hypothetical protein
VPQLDEDFRGKPRQISSDLGIVAADNSRCSEVGASALQVPAAPYPAGDSHALTPVCAPCNCIAAATGLSVIADVAPLVRMCAGPARAPPIRAYQQPVPASRVMLSAVLPSTHQHDSPTTRVLCCRAYLPCACHVRSQAHF